MNMPPDELICFWTRNWNWTNAKTTCSRYSIHGHAANKKEPIFFIVRHVAKPKRTLHIFLLLLQILRNRTRLNSVDFWTNTVATASLGDLYFFLFLGFAEIFVYIRHSNTTSVWVMSYRILVKQSSERAERVTDSHNAVRHPHPSIVWRRSWKKKYVDVCSFIVALYFLWQQN